MAGRSIIPEDVERRFLRWQYAGALAWCALYGWSAFVRDSRVPILEFADIAVHEIGHRLFLPFGEVPMLVMGDGTQVLFPLVLAIAFFAWRRNLVAASMCLAWCAEALSDTARYIADATCGCLTLLGAREGDWERILGPGHWNKLHLAAAYARNVHTWGVAVWWVAAALAAFGLALTYRGDPRRPRPVARQARPPEPVSAEQMWR